MWEEFKILETFNFLLAEYQQQTSADEIMNFLQLHLVMQGISYHFIKNRVFVSDIQHKVMRQLSSFLELGKCYANAELASDFFKKSKIVIGYWYIDKPVEHAWLRHGTTYFDPTYQHFFKSRGLEVKGYYPVAEISKTEYVKLKELTLQDTQPGLKIYFKSLGIDYNKLSRIRY